MINLAAYVVVSGLLCIARPCEAFVVILLGFPMKTIPGESQKKAETKERRERGGALSVPCHTHTAIVRQFTAQYMQMTVSLI